MSRLDLYASLGAMIALMARSPYHRGQPLRRYLAVEILPPLRLGQARIWFDESGAPTAFLTFACITPAVEAELHASGRALRPDEWACGERLFFNDFVAPYGGARAFIRDLKENVFRHRTATSLARAPDGRVRAIKRWFKADGATTEFAGLRPSTEYASRSEAYGGREALARPPAERAARRMPGNTQHGDHASHGSE
ncbi:toxin-activating lysine-acyltransferase [Salinarimonas sp.]|uniref:toxin-activating lysine-acyltransferase n=1 Tax=Salinarimonas sp. TaxID=2766526 RepID=UPI0032D8F53C